MVRRGFMVRLGSLDWLRFLAKLGVKVKSHVMTLTSIGSKDSTVNLVRTEKGHYLQVGCWEGTVQTLMEEVYKGSEKWVCDAATKTAMD